jgi:peptidyl-prolyl cis-trans isomerase SurA
VAPLKDVEPQIEDQIGMQKMQPALRAYLTQLRENAYIDIRDGYQDSGASPNEMHPTYSAYTPPTRKVKKHVVRTRFNGRGRKPNPQTVAKNEQNAKPKVEKPGKKEKIRFGQAPRETLPPVTNAQQQVAANDGTVSLGAPVDADTAEAAETPHKKTRFADQARLPKKRKGPKVDPFAPPPVTTQELATQKQQDTALGLNGDTSKKKKKNPRKEGPKRRFSNEKKQEQQPASTPATQPAAAPATSGAQ